MARQLDLLSLVKNNSQYESIVLKYHEKMETASIFFTGEEFVKEELERVRTQFIQPFVVTTTNGKIIAEFKYSEYTKHAYKWLQMGQNWPLDKIINNAKKAYITRMGSRFYNEEEFRQAIIGNLQIGVAYLMYEKFLKAELSDIHKENQVNLMSQNFQTETREIFGDQYLKIFLRDGVEYEMIASYIKELRSVRSTTVSRQQSRKVNLTIYPTKAHDIAETKEEVELALSNYFNGSKIDPIFIEDPISSVSDKAYFQVMDFMLMLGKNLEGFKRLSERFDEERYRDYFLPALNTISKKHSATGESFHSRGKSDILFLNEEGVPILIAECKLWKGEKLLLEAIDQLLNTYVNWRDEKVALIIFNRDVKKFTDIIDTATIALGKHPLCLEVIGQRKETSYSYIFHHPNDKRKRINFELILFNFS